MVLEDNIRQWFDTHNTLPTFRITADVGCDREVLIPAINNEGTQMSARGIISHIETIFTTCPGDELYEYLEGNDVTISVGPNMTREEYEALEEFDGC